MQLCVTECAHVCACDGVCMCVCVYLPCAKQMLYLTAKQSKKYVKLLSLTLLTASALLCSLSLSCSLVRALRLYELLEKSSQPQ